MKKALRWHLPVEGFRRSSMGSEEEVYAAKESLGIVAREVLAIEVFNSRVNVRERNISCADFPALFIEVAVSRVVRRHERNVLAEITISSISAPRALVGNIRALIGELNVMRRVVVVSFFVLCESTEEIPVVVELVASTDGPDVCIIGTIRIVAVVCNLREGIAVEMTISSTKTELARSIVEFNPLIVSCAILLKVIIRLRCIVVSIDVVVRIFKVPTACFERSLEVLAKRYLCTREEIIKYEAVISNGVQRHFTEFDVKVLVLAISIDVRQFNVAIIALVAGHIRLSRQTSFNMPVLVDFSRREETKLKLISVVFNLRAIILLIARARVSVTSLARP